MHSHKPHLERKGYLGYKIDFNSQRLIRREICTEILEELRVEHCRKRREERKMEIASSTFAPNTKLREPRSELLPGRHRIKRGDLPVKSPAAEVMEFIVALSTAIMQIDRRGV